MFYLTLFPSYSQFGPLVMCAVVYLYRKDYLMQACKLSCYRGSQLVIYVEIFQYW